MSRIGGGFGEEARRIDLWLDDVRNYHMFGSNGIVRLALWVVRRPVGPFNSGEYEAGPR